MKNLWKTYGDRCSYLFHKIINCSTSDNHISSLEIKGTSSTDTVQIKEHIVAFFKDLYKEEVVHMLFFQGLECRSLDKANIDGLETLFTKDEIYKVLCSLTGDKSPGPDGLQMEVFKVG